METSRGPATTIPRRYQLQLLEKAKEQNTIVYLETGCGKTHVAVMLLQHFSDLIRKPSNNIAVFLCPTRVLALQQAKVISQSTDLKVGTYSGDSNVDTWKLETWQTEVEEHELACVGSIVLEKHLGCLMLDEREMGGRCGVAEAPRDLRFADISISVVVIPDHGGSAGYWNILQHFQISPARVLATQYYLSSLFCAVMVPPAESLFSLSFQTSIKTFHFLSPGVCNDSSDIAPEPPPLFYVYENIELLIFDECHHAGKRHPYARIMNEFYHTRTEDASHKLPRILGMTASPIDGKVDRNGPNIGNQLNKIEGMLHAKVYTVTERVELDLVVPCPTEEVEFYNPSDFSNPETQRCALLLSNLKVESIRRLLASSSDGEDRQGKVRTKVEKKAVESIEKLHNALEYCLSELGHWCAYHAAAILIGRYNSNRETFGQFVHLDHIEHPSKSRELRPRHANFEESQEGPSVIA